MTWAWETWRTEIHPHLYGIVESEMENKMEQKMEEEAGVIERFTGIPNIMMVLSSLHDHGIGCLR